MQRHQIVLGRMQITRIQECRQLPPQNTTEYKGPSVWCQWIQNDAAKQMIKLKLTIREDHQEDIDEWRAMDDCLLWVDKTSVWFPYLAQHRVIEWEISLTRIQMLIGQPRVLPILIYVEICKEFFI